MRHFEGLLQCSEAGTCAPNVLDVLAWVCDEMLDT